MPQEINFPDSLDDDNSLYIVVNNLRTRLTSNITDSVTTIPVISTAGYPNVGFVTILTGAVITNAEAIAYSGTNATNFLNAERGSDGTAAFAHLANDNVDLTIVARHHENVKDAIIEIERFIGVSGSENLVPFVDGNVVLPGTLSVEETITVSGGANFCFVAVTGTLTVSGIPVMINVPDDIVINSIQAESATFTDLTVTGTGSFTNSLTVSGVPVSTGTGGTADPLNIGTLNASLSLTISGQPVSTGTVDTDALADLFVNKTGDTMTGNLDMLGNNVFNAGVAAVQDAAPTVVTSGLLWFDSDAVGVFPSDPNIPKGGIFAATVSTSSGITLPNDSSLVLTWDTEDLDEGDWFESEFPTRLTVPSGVTHLQAQAGVRINVDDFGDRNVQISLTSDAGTEVIATQQWSTASGTRTVAQVTSKIVTVSGGDYLEASAFQDSGGTLDTFVAGDYYFSTVAVNTRGVPGVNSVNLLKGDISILPGSGVEITSNSGDNTILISTVSGLLDTRTFFTAPTSGAAATVLNTVVVENGLIKSWTQV